MIAFKAHLCYWWILLAIYKVPWSLLWLIKLWTSYNLDSFLSCLAFYLIQCRHSVICIHYISYGRCVVWETDTVLVEPVSRPQFEYHKSCSAYKIHIIQLFMSFLNFKQPLHRSIHISLETLHIAYLGSVCFVNDILKFILRWLALCLKNVH